MIDASRDQQPRPYLADSRPSFTDTHVHFIDRGLPSLGGYEWLDPDRYYTELGDHGSISMARYLAEDFIAETRFQNVGKVIHVQAAIGIEDPVEETKWLQASIDRVGIPHGIVAHVDLDRPDAGATIERHMQFPAMRGVRAVGEGLYQANERWEQGYALLEPHGLICCDDPTVDSLPAAARVVERHPGIVYCVNHAGAPLPPGHERYGEWRDGLRKLAALPNTVVKISGLGMADHRWTVESIRPWVLECIDAWGTERAFFATNWPVDRLYSSYGDILEAYFAIISDLTPAEQEALFNGNADRIFRL